MYSNSLSYEPLLEPQYNKQNIEDPSVQATVDLL